MLGRALIKSFAFLTGGERESILSSSPQVGSLEGVYHFVHGPSPARSQRSLPHKHRDLMAEELVRFAEQQVLLQRVKRYSPPSDAKWPQQWYLVRLLVNSVVLLTQLEENKDCFLRWQFQPITSSFIGPALLPLLSVQHRKNHHDMNVQLAWEQDIIGRGAVVSILDDGG